jgi:cephalosporin hydroxylase
MVLRKIEQDMADDLVAMRADEDLHKASLDWMIRSGAHRYVYHFAWQGRPIIQLPQDLLAMQELLWLVKPDLVIETGIAHGGSLVFNASMLALLDYEDAVKSRTTLDPSQPKRKVLGLDIDIRARNRAAIEAHPMASRIIMIEGSSVAATTLAQVQSIAAAHTRILVCLDSNHTHDHVLAELEAYAPLVTQGSYCVVFDTIVEDLPSSLCADRPWGRGNSPKTAVAEYLRRIESEGRKARDGGRLSFVVDRDVETKLQVTCAPGGYLRRS